MFSYDLCLALQDDKPYISKKYAKMWYKKYSSVGIRRKLGDGKQIWSFGSNSELDKDALMQLGDQCLQKLDDGMTEDAVKEWVLDQCK